MTLVVLVIAMTVIAVLVTSLVSIVADKNKSMIYAYDGFHASVIADSGAEFAIRYISDGLMDTSHPYFSEDLQNNGGSISWKSHSPVYKLAGVTDPIGKFKVTRNFSTTISGDYVLVESDYNKGMAVRKLRINEFRRFLSPITLYPAYAGRPYRDTGNDKRIYVPVIGNHSIQRFTIPQIDLTVPASNMYLRYMNVRVPGYPISPVFDYTDTAVIDSYPDCDTSTEIPCLSSVHGLKLNNANVVTPLSTLKGMRSHFVYNDYRNDYYLDFASTAPAGSANRYVVKIYASTWQPELKFVPNPTKP